MTTHAICDACECVSHCSKNGCVPLTPIFRAPSVGCSGEKTEALHTFLDAAAAEGLVLNGVDAADLYIEIFPERYAAAIATN